MGKLGRNKCLDTWDVHTFEVMASKWPLILSNLYIKHKPTDKICGSTYHQGGLGPSGVLELKKNLS